MGGAVSAIMKPISSVVGAVGGLVGGGGGGSAPAPVAAEPAAAVQPGETPADAVKRKDKLRASAGGVVTGIAGQGNQLGRTKSGTATKELLG